MLERMLLPFDYFTRRNEDMTALQNNLIVKGSRLDAQISEFAGLPKIYPINNEEYKDSLNTISDPGKREIYKICGNISLNIHGGSDCHHNAFRFIENWIFGDKKTPVNKWLAACLWYKLTLDPSADLYNWGSSHKELIQSAKRNGMDVCEWMNLNFHHRLLR